MDTTPPHPQSTSGDQASHQPTSESRQTPIRLQIVAITFDQACAFVTQHHSHHRPPQGWKFGTSVTDGQAIRGVIMAGRPVARAFDDGLTLEITRCCTDKTPNAASMLYGAIRRAAKALGYRRLITYTLAEEHGSSLRAAGWQVVGSRRGSTWNRAKRPRQDDHPRGPKSLWTIDL